MDYSGYGPLSPFGVVLLEKQLSSRLALTFDVSGSYTHRESDREASESSSLLGGLGGLGMDFRSSYFVNASLGVRWIFNPGGAVEVSGLASVGGLVGGAQGQDSRYVSGDDPDDVGGYAILDRDELTYSLGGSVGIAFERKLMDQLFLRFQTSLVQGYWGKNKVTSEQVNRPQNTDSSRIIDVGLSFTPAIQLRLEI